MIIHDNIKIITITCNDPFPSSTTKDRLLIDNNDPIAGVLPIGKLGALWKLGGNNDGFKSILVLGPFLFSVATEFRVDIWPEEVFVVGNNVHVNHLALEL